MCRSANPDRHAQIGVVTKVSYRKMTADSNHGSSMWIDIDDAVRIYAGMLRARFGSSSGAQAARETADRLRAKGDWSGVKAWEAVAALSRVRSSRQSNVSPGERGRRAGAFPTGAARRRGREGRTTTGSREEFPGKTETSRGTRQPGPGTTSLVRNFFVRGAPGVATAAPGRLPSNYT